MTHRIRATSERTARGTAIAAHETRTVRNAEDGSSPGRLRLWMMENTRAASILDRVSSMIWTYDDAGRLDYVNAAWVAFTGLPLAEARLVSNWALLLPDEDRVRLVIPLRQAILNGETLQLDVRLKHRSGKDGFRWHAIRIEPVRASDGRVASWLGTAIDIDDCKNAQDALILREFQYQQERARSTSYQKAVLPPSLPSVPGLKFDAIYEPGTSDAQVGGDWYDAVRLLDGRVMLTIGDVAGSGLNAAVIMGVVRQIMRGIAQLHAEPALMLDAADRAMRLEYPDVLVTAWVGILDLSSRTLTYASAGHPPPLLLDPNGTIRELDHLTLPIGLRQGHQGHASTISLVNGSVLWMYTDGLIEAEHDLVEGVRRLNEAARDMSTASIVHPAASIRRLVIPKGSPDDVAILVVEMNFEEAERYLRRWQFDSGDADAARAARHEFTTSLDPRLFSAVDIANAEIVFGELCGNVARYAPGPVDVIVDTSGLQMVLHVLDRGVGFWHVSRLPKDPFSERGRGLFIIAAMTTEFTVTQRRGGGSEARAVLVGRYPVSLLRGETLPRESDQVPEVLAS